ncbi:PPOX class F420-dependent oxidoreductase [Amycolatopsis cihanbeyliensis]|uniref:Pyridoxamine 5'-phosphate oxidase family protein n=1 Tax=Amycolatopsis cihanbeyliensis TaxID=1128664 RepID=A0A542DFD6_AMYCI|nr:PPOX class F420-dependent oxidoreductase [Amycolatopsis cihanbeyliensis]TQJ01792.1 pyridoxamine 5'-phosphate oxidase family protein [Amycolatopsis cihanbeyliensis]
MSVFTSEELTYLRGQRLGRIATVGPDGSPHVAPVGWNVDDDRGVLEVGGIDLPATKKFRDVARTGRAAIVVDDLASVDPWRPRGVEIRGRAEAVEEPHAVIRIHPERIISWGLGPARSARSVTTAAPRTGRHAG